MTSSIDWSRQDWTRASRQATCPSRTSGTAKFRPSPRAVRERLRLHEPMSFRPTVADSRDGGHLFEINKEGVARIPFLTCNAGIVIARY